MMEDDVMTETDPNKAQPPEPTTTDYPNPGELVQKHLDAPPPEG